MLCRKRKKHRDESHPVIGSARYSGLFASALAATLWFISSFGAHAGVGSGTEGPAIEAADSPSARIVPQTGTAPPDAQTWLLSLWNDDKGLSPIAFPMLE